MTANHSGGANANKIDAGYPCGNCGLSSKCLSTWYLRVAL